MTSSDHRHPADWPVVITDDRNRAGQTWRTYDTFVLITKTFTDIHSKGKWLWHDVVILSDPTHPDIEGKHEKVAEMLETLWEEEPNTNPCVSWARMG